jgi:hypothetical protein
MEDMNMRKISVLALAVVIALGLAAAGCGGKAEAKLVTCGACGGKVEASMVRMVEGKQICTACADKLEAAKAAGGEQGEMPSCVVCGMKMAKAEMVEAGGKWYCRHCAPEGAGKAEGGSASHDARATGGAWQGGRSGGPGLAGLLHGEHFGVTEARAPRGGSGRFAPTGRARAACREEAESACRS